MGSHIITKGEAEVLKAALMEKGELTFPVGSLTAGAVCATIYRAQKSNGQFKPKFSTRLNALCSDGYTSVLAFALWIGPENVEVWCENLGTNSIKVGVRMKLKPNKALKCAPEGPDTASLRRLT